MVVVTGGYGGRPIADTEILDLAIGEWQPGPELPRGDYTAKKEGSYSFIPSLQKEFCKIDLNNTLMCWKYLEIC